MVVLTRKLPDVPEQFISVKFIGFALIFNPVMFVVYRHNPAKLMPEHFLGYVRVYPHLR